MVSPEKHEDIESLRQSVIAKARLLLGESYEHRAVFVEINGIVHALAVALRGRRFERRGSLQIRGGYASVEIVERGTERSGKLKPNVLIISGLAMADSEGRSVDRLFQIELYKHAHPPELYEALTHLLDSPESERDELFDRIAEEWSGEPS